jgi:hypothetical protein
MATSYTNIQGLPFPNQGLPVPDNFGNGEMKGASPLDMRFLFLERSTLYDDDITNHLLPVGKTGKFVVDENYQYRVKYTLFSLCRKAASIIHKVCPQVPVDSPFMTFPELILPLGENYSGPRSRTVITSNMDLDKPGPLSGYFTYREAIDQDNRCKNLGKAALYFINQDWNENGPTGRLADYSEYAHLESIFSPGCDGYVNATYPGFAYVGEDDDFMSFDGDGEDNSPNQAPSSSSDDSRNPPLDYFNHPGSDADLESAPPQGTTTLHPQHSQGSQASNPRSRSHISAQVHHARTFIDPLIRDAGHTPFQPIIEDDPSPSNSSANHASRPLTIYNGSLIPVVTYDAMRSSRNHRRRYAHNYHLYVDNH